MAVLMDWSNSTVSGSEVIGAASPGLDQQLLLELEDCRIIWKHKAGEKQKRRKLGKTLETDKRFSDMNSRQMGPDILRTLPLRYEQPRKSFFEFVFVDSTSTLAKALESKCLNKLTSLSASSTCMSALVHPETFAFFFSASVSWSSCVLNVI